MFLSNYGTNLFQLGLNKQLKSSPALFVQLINCFETCLRVSIVQNPNSANNFISNRNSNSFFSVTLGLFFSVEVSPEQSLLMEENLMEEMFFREFVIA